MDSEWAHSFGLFVFIDSCLFKCIGMLGCEEGISFRCFAPKRTTEPEASLDISCSKPLLDSEVLVSNNDFSKVA